MDLLLGAAPRPAPAANLAEPADGHASAVLLEETGELLPAENTATELPAEPVADDVTQALAGELAVATETAELLPAGDTVIETVEPELPPAPTQPRRRRKRAPAMAAEDSSAPAEEMPTGEVVAEVIPPPETSADRQGDDADDEILDPAYVPMKLTVMVPAGVLAELARTVQTIRRLTGRRQPVNQGTVVAAALEMAFEEFKTKGATSQLVDKLRIE